jgi:hypothetical protein
MGNQKLGRKPNSQIRDNIVELLFYLKEAYGYELYKKYKKIYPQQISMRSVYYHLTKGVDLNIFNVKEIQEVSGNYSWGTGTKRVIFTLGQEAKPKQLKEIYIKLMELKRN